MRGGPVGTVLHLRENDMKHELTHGGDWAGFLREQGYLPLDYSSNVSPLGVP